MKYGEIEFWLFIEEHTNTRDKSKKLHLLEKMEVFIKKNVSQCYLFYQQEQKSYCRLKQGFSYDLNSGRSLPKVKSFIQFGDGLVKIEKELKFHKVKNDFQKMLPEVQTSK